MANDPVKRPLRVIPACPDRRPAAAGAARNDMAGRVESFLNILLTARDGRSVPSAPWGAPHAEDARFLTGKLEVPSPPAAVTARPANDPATEARAEAPQVPSQQARPKDSPPSAPPASSEGLAQSSLRPAPQAAKNEHEAGRRAKKRWAEQMATMVTDICDHADPAFRNWTATLCLDPKVLPETKLRLSLSPHWLSLRFISDSQQATALVSTYRSELVSLLEKAPNLPHGIDIEIA